MTDPDAATEAESNDEAGGPPFSGDADVTEEAVDFGDLSLPQRAFVAAAQNPSRGILVVGLFAFALAFYAAFWLSFPRVAGLLSAVAVVVAAVAAGAFRVLDRVGD